MQEMNRFYSKIHESITCSAFLNHMFTVKL